MDIEGRHQDNVDSVRTLGPEEPGAMGYSLRFKLVFAIIPLRICVLSIRYPILQLSLLISRHDS
jgi:hypothetical protein